MCSLRAELRAFYRRQVDYLLYSYSYTDIEAIKAASQALARSPYPLRISSFHPDMYTYEVYAYSTAQYLSTHRASSPLTSPWRLA